MKPFSVFVMSVLAVFAWSCSNATVVQPQDIPVEGVSLSRTAQALFVDTTFQLECILSPADATNRIVFWTSDNETVATVDQSGIVTGHIPGSSVVSVMTEDGGFSAGCAFTVSAAPVTSSLIIDYRHTDPALIPGEGIPAAAALSVYLEHASVGLNLSNGLNELRGNDSRFVRDNMEFFNRENPDTDVKFDGFYERLTDPAAAHYRNPADYDIMMMKLCFVDRIPDNFDNETEMYEYYREMMLSLEGMFPGTVFVWWTIPLMVDSYGNTFSTNYNSLIRNYCTENGKVLFDIASIESHEPDGNPHTDTYGIEALYDGYTDDGGHLDLAGRARAAVAFWNLVWRISQQ